MPNPELASGESVHQIPKTFDLNKQGSEQNRCKLSSVELYWSRNMNTTYQPLHASVQIDGLYGLFGVKASQ